MSRILPHCRVVPLPDDQVSFTIGGQEVTRWHFGRRYPRPFFYPLIGPSGQPLTRIGHPGAPNHDHHRSIWFAHQKVLGIDFWSDQTEARIRQLGWMAYQDGDDRAVMAVRLGWFDGHDPRPLLEQEVVAAVRPAAPTKTIASPYPEVIFDLQSRLMSTSATLELGQTNFGLLAVRVAASISEYFGGGRLTSSEGDQGEKDIFGKPARWMNKTGPVPGVRPATLDTNGSTYFDPPSNPGFPAGWHVREDGWMEASLTMNGPLELRREAPLTVRYRLLGHAGPADRERWDKVADEFAQEPAYRVEPAGGVNHTQYVVRQ